MTSVAEALQAEEQKAFNEAQQKKIRDAKPEIEFLHHIAYTQAARLGFVVTLLDGTVYETEGADFMFTDGLSIIHDKHRIYIPKTAIKTIKINNPEPAKALPKRGGQGDSPSGEGTSFMAN
jgi:hypothetical protein